MTADGAEPRLGLLGWAVCADARGGRVFADERDAARSVFAAAAIPMRAGRRFDRGFAAGRAAALPLEPRFGRPFEFVRFIAAIASPTKTCKIWNADRQLRSLRIRGF